MKLLTPHRVATVASWLAVRGIQEGQDVFDNIIATHPEWEFMIQSEQSKLKLKHRREFLFRFLSPLTTHPNDRMELWGMLMRI